MTKILAEYIWLDCNQKPRSKTKVLNETPNNIDELPVWNYDGSSTDISVNDILLPQLEFDEAILELREA